MAHYHGSKVSPYEVDVIVVDSAPDPIELPHEFTATQHVICFTPWANRIPGPVRGTLLIRAGKATREEFYLPELPLALDRLRRLDMMDIQNTKDWMRIDVTDDPAIEGDLIMEVGGPLLVEEARQKLRASAAILTADADLPLGTVFIREDCGKGVAWLPHKAFDRTAWVRALCRAWAEGDPEGLPGLWDWRERAEWMTPAESLHAQRLIQLDEQKREFLAEHTSEVAVEAKALADAQRAADTGPRRLVTTQGEDLVAAVAEAFETLGFQVERVDHLLSPDKPKREDLRLGDGDAPSWNAIVEVRGYSKSPGKTADLFRLDRFAGLYERETGEQAVQRLYVVNGPLDLPPDQREEPFASASEDLEVFAESGGLVVSGIDLFLLSIGSLAKARVRQAIRLARGRWDRESVLVEDQEAPAEEG